MRPYLRQRAIRGRPLWKIAADAAAMLAIAIGILLVLDQIAPIGWRPAVIVADGDSLRDGNQRIRLYGIDAPELAQECHSAAGRSYGCGQEARLVLERLIGGEDLACHSIDADRYGRDVAICRTERVELNREMVRLGWAVAYRRHSIEYMAAEATARRLKLGLWQGPFELPEHYRARQHGSISRGSVLGLDDEGEHGAVGGDRQTQCIAKVKSKGVYRGRPENKARNASIIPDAQERSDLEGIVSATGC